MALFKSQIVTQASGSVGGTTYAHSRNGLVMRSRTIPVKSSSAYAANARNRFNSAAQYWQRSLTSTQRKAWQLYADNVPLIGPLGDARQVSGNAAFERAKSTIEEARPLGIIDGSRAFDAPTIFNQGIYSAPTAQGAIVGNFIVLTYPSGTEWAQDDEAVMLVYQHQPANPSRSRQGSSTRLIGGAQGQTVESDGGINLDYLVFESAGWPRAEGDLVQLSLKLLTSDNRVSGPHLLVPFNVEL